MAQWEEQVEEEWSSSKAEEDPVDDEDEEDDEEEDEEEEEDPGSNDGYGSGEDEEDKDLPPALTHRPVTRSTPKKPISWPKRKAHMSKGSGPRSSFRKRSKGQE